MAEQLENEKDIRLKVTTRIWGCAVGMLGICIPLTAVTNSGPIIPLGVVAGAAAGTAVVWVGDKKSPRSLPPIQLQQIEQRLANLETIIGSDDLDVRLKIKQLESGASN
ncbi:hypothetical protein [Microseira sp. BLCC-F43]|uniref:hypothetical protein n=1 Tax=Microseira sp. BLCC-F43 TaxID=3153602 RepID=UPI0035BAEEFB